jgi:hypothetical protein
LVAGSGTGTLNGTTLNWNAQGRSRTGLAHVPVRVPVGIEHRRAEGNGIKILTQERYVGFR